MQTRDLGGQWNLKQSGKKESIPATVPGLVHTDLLSAGAIPNPYYRDNEDSLQWIGETKWVYSRTFDLAEDFLQHDQIMLQCEGLDTLAIIKINSQEIARTENMFRNYEFSVGGILKQGRNTIEIGFDSTVKHVNQREKERRLPAWKSPRDIKGGNWVRKEQCNFGWDWGPCLVTCGIWRPIRLMAYNSARLIDVHVRQKHLKDASVVLNVTARLEKTRAVLPVTAKVILSREGQTIVSGDSSFIGQEARLSLNINDPQLWWPNGMGEHPLYTVIVNLISADGTVLDSVKKSIGLRTLRLNRKKDRWGETFRFVVNGIPFFAKGANWIPADTFATSLTDADYRDLLASAAGANMNMLRVWGGGIYEADVFYDLCDELGICIWQDFMFSCATYPAFDEAFMVNVRRELEDTVRRLRHHASLALWCGNNELEQGLVGEQWDNRHMSWTDYSRLFDVLIPETVKRTDSEHDYWPGSPHTPVPYRKDFNDDRFGDAHLWNVWHGKEPFDWYLKSQHRFISEFGFQSFPQPKTVRVYTLPADRNITSFVMEHHQRSPIGNTTIMTYLLDWFRLPKTFEMTLWLSQILQGIAMQTGIEHWRRNMPRTMGALYWQLNDCWPVASWSSIDHDHRYKALHYMAKHFFSPLLVSAEKDREKGRVSIYVTSDLRDTCTGTLLWKVLDVEGEELSQGEDELEILPGISHRVRILQAKKYLKETGYRNLIFWMELRVDGKTVSTNFVTFARPKHMELRQPDISSRIRQDRSGRISVTLSAKALALWTWLELKDADARFSDNFFHILPGKQVEVTVMPGKPMSRADLEKKLQVYSLIDTYQ